jgi:hypothetical protein
VPKKNEPIPVHHDFFGRELAIGDTVALTAPSYRHLVEAEVYAFTPKGVRVRYKNTWNFGAEGHVQEYLAAPDFLIKRV